MTETLMT